LGGESETDHQCEEAEYCTVECKNIFFTAGAGAHAKPASHLASNNNNNEAQSFKFILMSSETRINKENREG
jgi:hypothetical protein